MPAPNTTEAANPSQGESRFQTSSATPTKELSQDALICWLVACAKEADGELRECGLAFVEALMRSGNAG